MEILKKIHPNIASFLCNFDIQSMFTSIPLHIFSIIFQRLIKKKIFIMLAMEM